MLSRDQQSGSFPRVARNGRLLAIMALFLVAAGNDDFQGRRLELERLSPPELQAMRDRLATFQHLDKAERDRLQTLYSELSKLDSESRNKLLATMDQFSRWLTTVTPEQRKKILSAKNAQEKLAATEAVMQEQEARFAKDLKVLRSKEEGDSEQRTRNATNTRRRNISLGDRERLYRIRAAGFEHAIRKANAVEKRQIEGAEKLELLPKFVASCALAVKYPVNAEVRLMFFEILREIPSSFWESQFVRDSFGGHSFDRMSEEEKSRFLGLLIFASSLQTTDDATLFRDSQGEKNPTETSGADLSRQKSVRDRAKSDLLAEVTGKDSSVLASICGTLLNVLYINDHRDLLSETQLADFESVLHPSEKEKQSKTGRLPQRLKELQDKRRESGKKLNKKED